MNIARWILCFAAIYLGAGMLFGIAFVLRGAGRLDPAARAGSVGFRLLLLPGATLLFPALAVLWLRVKAGQEELMR